MRGHLGPCLLAALPRDRAEVSPSVLGARRSPEERHADGASAAFTVHGGASHGSCSGSWSFRQTCGSCGGGAAAAAGDSCDGGSWRVDGGRGTASAPSATIGAEDSTYCRRLAAFHPAWGRRAAVVAGSASGRRAGRLLQGHSRRAHPHLVAPPRKVVRGWIDAVAARCAGHLRSHRSA